MTETKINQLADEADRLIKAGEINQVSHLIQELNFSKLPRRHHQIFARICRRSGLINQGLRLMHPIMRHHQHTLGAPTDSEICEYSSLLSRFGSVQEAIALLHKVDATKTPEASLYLGHCYIQNWDYTKAAELFKFFLSSNSDDYSKLIAQVNLASSYIIISKLTEAADMLERTIQMAEQIGATRLIGNCYELWGQIYFWQGDFTKAKNALNRALDFLSHTKTFDQLLIYKTESIIAALERKSAEPLIQFRQEAIKRKHWESVREADLFRLKVRFNQRELNHLVCGTPMPAYRSRIQQIVGAAPGESYTLGNENSKYFDIRTGTIDGKQCIPLGKRTHQALASLLKDFYVPRNVRTLFSDLYPGECFDLETSASRVRQVMMRTRQWLKENKIPVLLEHKEGVYRLHVQKDFGIKIHIETSVLDLMSVKWNELHGMFDGSPGFSAEEACLKLGWSRTSFRRFVDWALENSQLQKSGVGKATRYHFTSQIATNLGL